MTTPTPKKRSLGLSHYFISVKKQKSEEHLVKDEDSQQQEGLQDVKDEEVKTEKHDQDDQEQVDIHTPVRKYSRDDFVRWGKKGGRPRSDTKHTPQPLQKLIMKKASQE